jgi:ubiquinone/menaquinone biosynthesis C-methylase UbiE
MRQRAKVVPHARGRVLEVGIGTGLNLPFYDTDHVTKVWGLDPAPEMTKRAEEAAEQVPFEVDFLHAPGEAIPLDDDSCDTVVITYTLCSIPDAEAALRETARVLKKDGPLLFCEHGLAPDSGVRRWQNRVNPVWNRFSGGCHLNRDIPELIRRSGFAIRDLETMYLPGWRPASFNYWGTATATG